MPLSEQEQRMLDEMERHLLQRDADVVSAGKGAKKLSYRNIVLGCVLILLGVVALVLGVAIKLMVISILGFILMLGGVILAATPSKAKELSVDDLFAQTQNSKGKSKPAKKSFEERMNDRWDKRQDERP